jgi:glycosyltransferase involved in cell wall biosynthesis
MSFSIMSMVSIIIPTHNRPSLLRRAVTSALAQDYANFEIIIVDDSPSDDAKKLIDSFKDQRLRYLRVGPMTASAARNIAIDQAKGEYIAFLDDDDEWLPTKLSRQLEKFDECDEAVALVYSGLNFINETKEFKRVMIPVYRGNVLEKLLEVGFVRSLSTVVVRTEVLREINGFDAKMPSLHDWDLYLRVAKKHKFDFVAAPLVNYYVNYQGIMHDIEKQLTGHSAFYSKYKDQLRPRALSNYYLFRGVALFYHDEPRNGRLCLVESLQVNWRNYKAIPVIALSLLGGAAFKRLYTIFQDTPFANAMIRMSDL